MYRAFTGPTHHPEYPLKTSPCGKCIWHSCLKLYLSVWIFLCLRKQTLGNHNIDTRQWNSLYLHQANLTIYQEQAYYSAGDFNNLPLEIKNVTDNLKKFKIALKAIFVPLFYFTHGKNIFIHHELCTVLKKLCSTLALGLGVSLMVYCIRIHWFCTVIWSHFFV